MRTAETDKWIKEFQRRLKSRMEYLEISQLELSKRTGIHQAEISRYVRGKNIPLANNISKLARALSMDVRDLIDFLTTDY